MKNDNAHMSLTDINDRYGWTPPAIIAKIQRDAMPPPTDPGGNPRPPRGRQRSEPFPEPDVTVGSARGWKVSTIDSYMARRNVPIISEKQFGPRRDSFGVLPWWLPLTKQP